MTDDHQPYLFRHAVEVRFKDIDVGGHAHHSHALVYFEEARAAYWRQVVGRSPACGVDYVLADASLRWHHRVMWPGCLDVSVRVSLLGRKHFRMDYLVDSPEGERLVSGSTVQVMYDYTTSTSKRVPADVRARIIAHEGVFGRSGKWEGANI